MIKNINLNDSTVSAELHGYMYENIYGYTGVFKYGSALAYEIVSNNEIKIKDGLLCNAGRFMRITGSESIAIENGSSGVTRTDLIVAHFESDGINETHDIRVIRGTSGGEVPSYTTGDIYSGDTINELPLYAIHLNGLTVESVEKLFGDLLSFDELRNNVSNPNLLINSDFRDFIINQRGKASYLYTDADTQYTIDRWCASGVNVSVGTSGITAKNRSGLSTSKFFQPFETELKAGTYTVTVGCQEVSGIYVDIDESGSTKHQLSNGVNTFTFTTTDKIKGFYFFFAGESTDEGAYLYYVKLEKGSVATPLISRHYAEELALCQRYYQVIRTTLSSYQHNTTSCFFKLSFITTMRTSPTIKYTVTDINKHTGELITASSTIYSISDYRALLKATYSSQTGTVYYYCLTTTYNIDAEIY